MHDLRANMHTHTYIHIPTRIAYMRTTYIHIRHLIVSLTVLAAALPALIRRIIGLATARGLGFEVAPARTISLVTPQTSKTIGKI